MIQAIQSPLGSLFAVWNTHGLRSLIFSDRALEESVVGEDDWLGTEVTQSGSTWSELFESESFRELACALERYFAGGELQFPLESLDWSGIPKFHQQVLRACAAIPRGETMTYGALAAQVGSPGAARAVGQAMAKNRWPLIVPCHRVVGSTGKLTGYSGRGGTVTKQALLDFEAGEIGLFGHSLAS